MTHIFIVNKTTFKIHLENMFAGTGASDVSTDFIFDPMISLNWQDEKRSVEMIADLARIRKGDKIIFFVTGIAKFYGVFEAVSEFFVDPNDADNYLLSQLNKILTYRILIKPYKVFQKGLSEFDYLDTLEGLNTPDEMCWSLIYRKLGANRGCTMITDAEYQLFIKRICNNNNTILTGKHFSFDSDTNQILSTTQTSTYKGRQLDVSGYLFKNLTSKYKNHRKTSFEHYIQFLTIMMLKGTNYTHILSSNKPITWIGNEVMCSFGEHRMDVLTIQEDENLVDISIIELKDEKINIRIINQLIGYIHWLKDYIFPFYLRKQKKINVYPIIISDGLPNARVSTRANLQNVENEVISYKWSCYNNNMIEFKSTKIIHFNDII